MGRMAELPSIDPDPDGYSARWHRLYAEGGTLSIPESLPFAPAVPLNPRSLYAQQHADRGCDADAHAVIDIASNARIYDKY